MTDAQARRCLEAWRLWLGVKEEVRLERISPFQVTDERGRSGCSLVGVTLSESPPVIYHTRRLCPEDIVHELLHIAHPEWSEQTVVE
ncbi:MAG: hypothetical protein KatS3mg024_1284 [Armatimonadota bacterium]|nr:MAG: hypothetical protein KatS3mg024_1284 [Armatimonadota bacterium]